MKSILVITLLQLKGLGRKKVKDLLARTLNHPEDKNEIPPFIRRYLRKGGVPIFSNQEIAAAIQRAEAIIEESEKQDISIVNYAEGHYPKSLHACGYIPPVLYYKGDLSVLNKKNSIAVIGSRRATTFGLEQGRAFSKIIAMKGFNVLSGLALGCDTGGHLGALDCLGTTTAVLAHGLDMVYPKENKTLAEDILSIGGLLISEYAVGTKPEKKFYIERDQLQAALSNKIFMIESTENGGTMHAIDYGLEFGRSIACIQHPADYSNEPSVEANLSLIEQDLATPIGDNNDLTEWLNEA